ncbi:sigma-70 family RNA polymerase sigma factor [Nakamurella silvestris]|nr:sigma-70 family RNA polymerase sigma factor [Nakamurella silvestris]
MSPLRAVPDADPSLEKPVSERSLLDELLGQVARGDQQAYASLYDQMSPRVYGIARRVVRDPSQAEEVGQEVMLEVWRRATRFDPARGSALSWIMTIAHARSVDRVRSAQASTDRDVRYATETIERDTDVVVDAVEASFERKQVQRCLSTLTDLQRESINLAYYSGYTQAEVAVALQTPLGTVKTRLRDGLIRLRDCLGVPA